MGFHGINKENRQYVCLSQSANSILENDMLAFQITNRSTIINIIIDNFHEEAESTLTLSCQRYRTKLSETFSDSNLDDTILNQMINLLVDKFRKKTKETNTSIEKGASKYTSFKFRINTKNTNFFTKDSEENNNYEILGEYIRALLEEYARKRYLDREKIILKDKFDTIDDAIKMKTCLKVTTLDGSQITVRPYKITTDPLNMYHYLIGYQESTASNTLISFSSRVSNLHNIRNLRSHAFISSTAVKELEKELHEKGAQFMSSSLSEIKIRLTKTGIQNYNRILHLRPAYTNIEQLDDTEDAIYTFNCTPKQIEFYFFKFGSDAEILSPSDLRNNFIKMYQKTVNMYLHNK